MHSKESDRMEKRCALRRNVCYISLIVLLSIFHFVLFLPPGPMTDDDDWWDGCLSIFLKSAWNAAFPPHSFHLSISLSLLSLRIWQQHQPPFHFQLSSQCRVKWLSEVSFVMFSVYDSQRWEGERMERRKAEKRNWQRERDGMESTECREWVSSEISLSPSRSLLHSIKWKERWVLHTKHLLFPSFFTVQCPFLFPSSFLHPSIFLMSLEDRKRVH